jgi:hypothetical protein
MPFVVKRKVFNACFMACMTYGCESWINANVQPIEKLYVNAVKSLLGVRNTTSNDLCLIELGLPRLAASVLQRQKDFFVKMISDRRHLPDDPFMVILDLVKQSGSATAKRIDHLMGDTNFISDSLEAAKNNVRTKATSKSKFAAYLEMNPSLESPALYRISTPEHMRVAVSRLRLISHNLRTETGRWSRTERDRRLCPCGMIQTERHVVQDCMLVQDIRESCQNTDSDFTDIMKGESYENVTLLYKIMMYFN